VESCGGAGFVGVGVLVARVSRRIRGFGFLGRGLGVAGWSGQCGEFPESGEDLGE